jgi:CRISPR/Cas system endoribonuclease Cas6 (RAMP superfamily)
MVQDLSPTINENAAELLYHRAASAWGCGETFEVPNGVGEWVDLTKLFEQYRMIQILKGESKNGNSKNSN